MLRLYTSNCASKIKTAIETAARVQSTAAGATGHKFQSECLLFILMPWKMCIFSKGREKRWHDLRFYGKSLRLPWCTKR